MSEPPVPSATTDADLDARLDALDEQVGDATGAVEQPETLRTGVPTVDAGLALLDGLEERPVDEHAAVFETVHARLRSALTSGAEAGDEPAEGEAADGGAAGDEAAEGEAAEGEAAGDQEAGDEAADGGAGVGPAAAGDQ